MDKYKFISDQMNILAVPYEFGEWTQKNKDLYFVGEMPSPEEMPTEDGKTESTLIVTGFCRGKEIVLAEIAEKIRKHFHPIDGLSKRTENGVIIVYYGGAFFVPTGESELKKIQINLHIQEWKGDF